MWQYCVEGVARWQGEIGVVAELPRDTVRDRLARWLL